MAHWKIFTAKVNRLRKWKIENHKVDSKCSQILISIKPTAQNEQINFS